MTPRIATLFGQLERVGLPAHYVRELLPDWLTDAALECDGVEAELKLALAKRFGLDVRSLFQPDSHVDYRLPDAVKFKRTIPAYQQDLTAATSIAASVARIVATAFSYPYKGLPADPLELRKEILEVTHGKWISLNAVVYFALLRGIPTVHLGNFPDGMKCMDGMVAMHDGRPVIVLSKQSPFRAWQLFIIAHELGHCALGHVSADELLVDEVIGEETYLLGGDDPDEIAADRYALALLNGKDDVTYEAKTEDLNAAALARAAMQVQNARLVDAGHVILNFGHRNRLWGLAVAALRLLGEQNAQQEINAILFQHLQRDAISQDALEFLHKATGFVG